MTPIASEVTIDVEGCARCHGDGHPALTFRRLAHPVACNEVLMEFWAACPTNGEPILLAYVEREEPEEPSS